MKQEQELKQEQEQELEPSMLSMQVNADIPGVLDRGVRHVEKVHGTVVTKLAFLVGEVDLGPGNGVGAGAGAEEGVGA